MSEVVVGQLVMALFIGALVASVFMDHHLGWEIFPEAPCHAEWQTCLSCTAFPRD
jgi:hypothetical protein